MRRQARGQSKGCAGSFLYLIRSSECTYPIARNHIPFLRFFGCQCDVAFKLTSLFFFFFLVDVVLLTNGLVVLFVI
jgi:hypothetical protein